MKKPTSGRGPRVLIVDDHDISRQFIVSVLRRNEISVGQARFAREAVAVALGWLPHVILMDVRLAGEDGYATARWIRAQWPPNRPLPAIVMLSAEPQAGHSLHASTDAPGDFLLKPFSAGQLMEAVRRHCPPSRPATRLDANPPGDLQKLFRAELAAQLKPLERAIAGPDLPAARSILHRLIASSALCQQPRLERDLRALHSACGESAEVAGLARPYFSLLASARDYLGGS